VKSCWICQVSKGSATNASSYSGRTMDKHEHGICVGLAKDLKR
jgi:hypothetical protein